MKLFTSPSRHPAEVRFLVAPLKLQPPLPPFFLPRERNREELARTLALRQVQRRNDAASVTIGKRAGCVRDHDYGQRGPGVVEGRALLRDTKPPTYLSCTIWHVDPDALTSPSSAEEPR